MGYIKLLDKNTIDKIAAGEVIERPASVIKELVENAIDAGAGDISIEIKDGGINYIRITDNGKGISDEDVPMAFKRHATSKINEASDLMNICSLGFRGEALSSISSVSMVELMTKTKDSISGTRYVINGGTEIVHAPVGIPNGTTIIVSSLFYNVPARRKYLGSAQAEGSRIMELIQAFMLSHPEVSFKFVNQGRIRLLSYGKAGQIGRKEAIYAVLGADAAKHVIELEAESEYASVKGYIGTPEIGRGSRAYEYCFVNGRYIKCRTIESAVEDGYKGFFMQHKFPLFVLSLDIPPEDLDVNVHPAKMEIRLKNEDEIYEFIKNTVKDKLSKREWIIQAELKKDAPIEKSAFEYGIIKQEKIKVSDAPEPFEERKIEENRPFSEQLLAKEADISSTNRQHLSLDKETNNEDIYNSSEVPVQMDLNINKKLLDEKNIPDIRIVGQVFDTYWILEFDNKMYFMDQHAAHEKVLYEQLINSIKSSETLIQSLSPPMIVSITPSQMRCLDKNKKIFEKIGFTISSFGGNDIAVSSIPYNLPALNNTSAFMELLDRTEETRGLSEDIMLEKCASMACKAAVKGKMRLSVNEASALVEELMGLENPYHCPHGRPTMISMSKQEIEKRFGRLI